MLWYVISVPMWIACAELIVFGFASMSVAFRMAKKEKPEPGEIAVFFMSPIFFALASGAGILACRIMNV